MLMKMAEKSDNWFGSWLSAAKNKSCEVLEFVKKDLEEFGSVVKNEASQVVSATGNAIEKTLKLDEPESTASTMKRSISSFLGQMNEVLNLTPDDDDTEAILIVDGEDPVTLNRSQRAVYELQKDERTFTENPHSSLMRQYESWLEIIEDKLSEDRLSKHLRKSVTLKNQYTGLVPLKVDHELFWKRYLFKKAILEYNVEEEERKERAKAREEARIAFLKRQKDLVNNDSLQWNEEDFAKDIELTEEEQIKILEQYENETKTKKVEDTILLHETENTNETKILKDYELDDDIEIINKDSINGVSNTNCSSKSSTDSEWEKISDK